MASHPVGELYAHRDVSVLTGSHIHDSSRRIYSCIKSRNIGVVPSWRDGGRRLVALARVCQENYG